MSNYYNAFDVSPVPAPGPDAQAPEPFHGIYGMPMFLTIPTADLTQSVEFWTQGLGFFELFAIPGQLVHLRRWAFQDVLLVAGEAEPGDPPVASVSFACVLNQVEGIVQAVTALRPGSVTGPTDTPWNTRDIRVITPENAHVVFTAAKPHEPGSAEAANLAQIGIEPPAGPQWQS